MPVAQRLRDLWLEHDLVAAVLQRDKGAVGRVDAEDEVVPKFRFHRAVGIEDEFAPTEGSVSYTHLTLPTIYSV